MPLTYSWGLPRGNRASYATAPAAAGGGGGDPVLTSLNTYGDVVGTGDTTLTATGTFQPGDEIVLWNTALTTTYVNATTLQATVTSAKFASANFGSVWVKRGSTGRSYALPFEAYPTNGATSSYVQGLSSAITPSYGGGGAGSPPAKGSSVTQATTGCDVKRITDITDPTPDVGNFRIIYSKWSSINATNEYAIAEIEDSATCYLIRLSDNANLGKITGTSNSGGSFGENFEPRWSTRGDEPYTIYYMTNSGSVYGGKVLRKKDVVTPGSEVTVKDFTTPLSLGGSEYLYCDSEGSPSIDMRFWAFMRREDSFSGVREFIVYDVHNDTMARCKSATTSGFFTINATGGVVNTNQFNYRPNWVSMSPRGDRVQLGYGRVYSGLGRDATFGSDLDMPHTFKSADWSDSIVCAVDETHGGWSWGPNMEQAWTYQNNRLDTMEVCLNVANSSNSFRTGSFGSESYPAANAGTNGRRKFIDLSGTWNNSYSNEPGQHYMWQMSGVRRGFSFVGTDGTYNASAYGYNNLLVIRHSDGRIWRAGTLPHQYADYFSEVQWCAGPFGTLLAGHLNWRDNTYTGTPRAVDEVYTVELPEDWHTNAIWS